MRIILCIVFLLSANYVFAQDTGGATKQKADTAEKIFTIVEVMPRFPGDEVELFRYLLKNVKYPKAARKNKIEGKVILTFVVDKNGTVRDVRVIQSVSPELDEEALRVIKLMPQWTPGTQNDRPVSVYFTIPIKFALPKN